MWGNQCLSGKAFIPLSELMLVWESIFAPESLKPCVVGFPLESPVYFCVACGSLCCDLLPGKAESLYSGSLLVTFSLREVYLVQVLGVCLECFCLGECVLGLFTVNCLLFLVEFSSGEPCLFWVHFGEMLAEHSWN